MSLATSCQRNSVDQQHPDRIQTLANTLWAAGKVYDEAGAAQASHAPREPRAGLMLASRQPYLLRDARCRAFDGCRRRLRGDVARRAAGSASGNDEIGARRPANQRRCNLFGFIRDNLRSDNFKAERPQTLPRGRPRLVVVDPGMNAVTHRDHGGAKRQRAHDFLPFALPFAASSRMYVPLRPPLLCSRHICSMVMPWPAALHMS